ncbi:MAG: hypothetical protein KDC38_13645, partial [Planctomycetes bacterium]|nr:hypothetical protein [Planctomycetota bacterium]
VINNVDDVDAAVRRAEARRLGGEIDDFALVRDHLSFALEECGLSIADLGRIPHYSDWALVAVTLPGSPWLVHCDAEVEVSQAEPGRDWISASIERLEQDPRLLVANPAWSPTEAAREAEQIDGSFALGYGFSDQLFLARRRELARPIYRERHPLSLRYPLAHIARTFECRVDAFMRCHERRRATHLDVEYRHCGPTGRSYPDATRVERWRRRWQRRVLRRYRNRMA